MVAVCPFLASKVTRARHGQLRMTSEEISTSGEFNIVEVVSWHLRLMMFRVIRHGRGVLMIVSLLMHPIMKRAMS